MQIDPVGARLAVDGIDPHGTVRLASQGGPYTRFPYGATPTLPTIFAHRDVGDTACPGSIGYACLDEIRAIAARFDKPASSSDLAEWMRGTAIWARWQAMGGMGSSLGAPTSPETPGSGSARYVNFDKGAVYYSPSSGAAPVTGAIYDAWATLGFERGELGLPTSGEIQEPLWIGQNFQHGTLNLDRQTRSVTRVIDGIALILPPPPPSGPPVQLKRFSPARNRAYPARRPAIPCAERGETTRLCPFNSGAEDVLGPAIGSIGSAGCGGSSGRFRASGARRADRCRRGSVRSTGSAREVFGPPRTAA